MAPRAAAAIAAAAAAAAVVVAVALLRRRRRKKALPPGLTLFERVLDAGACDALARGVDDLAARGARGELGPRCYTPVSSPSFAERRQSRVMLQFGAYANANRVENAATAPLPRELRAVAEKLVDAGSSEQNAMAIPLEYSKGVAYAIVEQRRQHILEAMGQNKADVNKFDWDKSGLDESIRAGWNFARDEAHHAMFSFIVQNVMQPDNDNDQLYRQVLIGRITELLQSLPTSMEEDVQIMEQCVSILDENDNNNDNETRLKALRLKTVCRYRGQKKAILHQWLNFLFVCLWFHRQQS